jgi:hypothetical protein
VEVRFELDILLVGERLVGLVRLLENRPQVDDSG